MENMKIRGINLIIYANTYFNNKNIVKRKIVPKNITNLTINKKN